VCAGEIEIDKTITCPSDDPINFSGLLTTIGGRNGEYAEDYCQQSEDTAGRVWMVHLGLVFTGIVSSQLNMT
jgi:hypothetical protein